MSSCDLWTGRINPGGYPTFGSGKLAHRAAYELAHPDEDITGLDVHHLCGTRACWNPEHLQAMDVSEHRKMHTRIRREAQTHCVNGHEWTDKNTDYITDSDGYRCRRCRECRLALQTEYRKKNPYIPKPKRVITHCPQDHEYTEENSGIATRKDGRQTRYCKQCNRDRVRAYYARLREAARA